MTTVQSFGYYAFCLAMCFAWLLVAGAINAGFWPTVLMTIPLSLLSGWIYIRGAKWAN